MAIPESFLEELTARCDIEDVVSGYLPLTRKGGNLWGLCPFHSEKTPSFSVSPDKQIFHCFGCGKGGGVIRFVQEVESLTFPEAVRQLAGKVGLELPDEDDRDKVRRVKRSRLLELNRQAARFYYDTLSTPLGSHVAEYIKQRQLAAAYIKRFGLGAAPDGWDHLLKAMTDQGFDKSELLECGLVVSGKSGGFYDKFRNRLMLPVMDARGDFLGFTSRVMDGSAPKYLNTPETELFKKRGILYGINYAKNTKLGYFLMVEGNLDVITLHQAGFDNAVATMGTALTADHVRLMSRYVKEVVICYDNDTAGADATERAMAVLKDSGFSVKILRLPRRRTEGGELVKQDPDDFIKFQGREAFARLLSNSEDQTTYRLGTIASKYDPKDDKDRAAFLKEAAQMIAALSSPVEREIYATRAAQSVGVSGEGMAREVEEARKKKAGQARRQVERQSLSPATQLQPKKRELRYENLHSARAEGGVVRLLLLDPLLFENAKGLEPQHFSSPLLAKVYAAMLARWQVGTPMTAAMLDGVLEGEEADLLAGLLQEPTSLADGHKALADYIEIITGTEKRRNLEQAGGVDGLLEMQELLKQKKGYGG